MDLDEKETTKRYMHHYNFPSYSVGETRPSRGPGRREIGHGALAERALGTSIFQVNLNSHMRSVLYQRHLSPMVLHLMAIYLCILYVSYGCRCSN